MRSRAYVGLCWVDKSRWGGNTILWFQCHWSRVNGTWQKRPRELDRRLRFEIEKMTLQMYEADTFGVVTCTRNDTPNASGWYFWYSAAWHIWSVIEIWDRRKTLQMYKAVHVPTRWLCAEKSRWGEELICSQQYINSHYFNAIVIAYSKCSRKLTFENCQPIRDTGRWNRDPTSLWQCQTSAQLCCSVLQSSFSVLQRVAVEVRCVAVCCGRDLVCSSVLQSSPSLSQQRVAARFKCVTACCSQDSVCCSVLQ